MMFHKDSKICFSLVPRCGSTSLRSLLLNLHVRELAFTPYIGVHHIKYKDAVKTYPNLANYLIYGVFRNPAKRLVSALNFRSLLLPISAKNFAKDGTVSISEIKKEIDDNPQNFLYHRQIEWFEGIPNSKVIDFDNFQAELNEALVSFDGDKTLPHRNKTAVRRVELTPEIEALARDYYAADYKFAKEVLGKEF